MASFRKKVYTDPVISKHGNDITKDWYVFFRYKHEGKVYKFKRREGVNRIKDLTERLSAIEDLLYDIKFDLKNGWNPILDPKREKDYNSFRINQLKPKGPENPKRQSRKPTKEELRIRFHSKGLY
jgi:hypothetical protein